MTESAKDAEYGNIFILESDMGYELIETEGDRQNAGYEEGLEQMSEVFGGSYSDIGEKAESEQVEDSEQFLEGCFCGEGIKQGHAAPEEDDKEGDDKRKGSQLFPFQNEKHKTKQGDADTQKLGKRESDVIQGDAEIL